LTSASSSFVGRQQASAATGSARIAQETSSSGEERPIFWPSDPYGAILGV
jgi:hypothetical protein